MAQLAGNDFPFENYFRIGGNFNINGFAFDHTDSFAEDSARNREFIDTVGRGKGGAKEDCRVGTDNDGDRHCLILVGIFVANTAGLSRQHQETGRLGIKDLLAMD